MFIVIIVDVVEISKLHFAFFVVELYDSQLQFI